MSPRWNWDFEDEQRAARAPARPPRPVLKVAQVARRTQFRRRRLGAALIFAAIVLVLAVALSSSGSPHHPSAADARARARATPVKPTDPMEDGHKAVTS